MRGRRRGILLMDALVGLSLLALLLLGLHHLSTMEGRLVKLSLERLRAAEAAHALAVLGAMDPEGLSREAKVAGWKSKIPSLKYLPGSQATVAVVERAPGFVRVRARVEFSVGKRRHGEEVECFGIPK